MENNIIELLKPVTLRKENRSPQIFEQGLELLKLMQAPGGLLVRDDENFNFLISLKDKNTLWREI